MKLKFFTYIIFIYSCLFFSTQANSNIKNRIEVKVGNNIITSNDVRNEINTILILSNKDINQKNINEIKSIALKSLMRKVIKKNEIEKFKITNYNKVDLEKRLTGIASNLNTDINGLKKIFKTNKINYENFVERFRVELLWNSLIFSLYKNQISVNMIQIENELEIKLKEENITKEYKLSEIEVSSKNENLNELLEKIYNKIKTNSFEAAAREFSISSSADKGGSIGWFTDESLSNIYRNTLIEAKIGIVTKPIKNLESVTILKITDLKVTNNNDINKEDLKARIVDQKKEEKLNLFSRSHYSNIENTIFIDFTK